MINGYGLGLNGYWILGIIIFAVLIWGAFKFICVRKKNRFDYGLDNKKLEGTYFFALHILKTYTLKGML